MQNHTTNQELHVVNFQVIEMIVAIITSCCSKFDFGLELGEFGSPAAFDLEEVLSIRELEAGEVALLIEVKSGDVL